MLELNIKDYFEDGESYSILVNNRFFGIVDNDDDFKIFVSKVIDTIKVKKPHYQIIINEGSNNSSITLNVISPGFIKNSYYVYNIVKEPSRKLKKNSFEIEIEHPSGNIDELIV